MPKRPKTRFNFLADEMIHGDLIQFLRASHCRVIQCPKGFKNGSVYQFAQKRSLIILTQDTDFCDEKRYPPRFLEGIVCLRVFPPTIANIIQRMKIFIHESEPRDIKGRLKILA